LTPSPAWAAPVPPLSCGCADRGTLVTTAAGLAAGDPGRHFLQSILQNIRDLGQRLDTFALEVSAQIEKNIN